MTSISAILMDTAEFCIIKQVIAQSDVGYSSRRGNEEFAKLIGGRRFDDKPTKTTKPNTPEQLELFGPEVDLGKKENT